ncbi:MAG: hypothetical protein WC483_00665 [Candidatus Paceibacterota bacterium]
MPSRRFLSDSESANVAWLVIRREKFFPTSAGRRGSAWVGAPSNKAACLRRRDDYPRIGRPSVKFSTQPRHSSASRREESAIVGLASRRVGHRRPSLTITHHHSPSLTITHHSLRGSSSVEKNFSSTSSRRPSAASVGARSPHVRGFTFPNLARVSRPESRTQIFNFSDPLLLRPGSAPRRRLAVGLPFSPSLPSVGRHREESAITRPLPKERVRPLRPSSPSFAFDSNNRRGVTAESGGDHRSWILHLSLG